MASQETALVCLKNHILVFHADSLYVYSDTLTEQYAPATTNEDETSSDLSAESPLDSSAAHSNPPLLSAQPFPLYSLDLLAVNRNRLLCRTYADTLAVFQFDTDKENTSLLLSPVLTAEYPIPDEYKVSVACWDTEQQFALLGTRDGIVLRLDLHQPGVLQPLCKDGSSSVPRQSATISSIAAAPCGDAIYAVGYASGLIDILQYSPAGLRTLYSIQGVKKILTLSWHYSSKNKASQSLATLRAGSDRLHIYTVNVSDNAAPPRKIRDIPLPSGQSIPSICTKSLQWAKGGKVVRVSDSGLVVSDVRTKRVSTRSISLPPPVITLDLKSTRGKAWVIDSDSGLKAINLIDGAVIDSTTLPFSLALASPILDSPVVFIHKPLHIHEVTYKNKRAMRSPLCSEYSTSPSTDTTTGSANPSPSLVTSPTRVVVAEPLHKPTNSISSSISTVSTLPTSSPHTYKPIQLSMQPVKAMVNSLFPSVTKTLSRTSTQQTVPEFFPSLSSREQYALSAIFGGTYSTALCLGGIVDILQHAISKEPGSFKSLIFSLLLSDISINQLILTLGKLPGEKRYSDRFVFTLLSIGSIDSTPDSEAASFTSSSIASSQQQPSCNIAIINLVQDLISSCEEMPSDDIHLVCAYMVSLGYYLEARQIFMNSNFFLEAFVVSLLGKVEFLSVFRQWCLHLRSNSSNPNLLNYLTEISLNIAGVPRHSMTSTNSISFDDTLAEDQSFSSRQISSTYSLTKGTPRSNISDDVAIFSPELASEDFNSTTPTTASNEASPPPMSSSRLLLMTPKVTAPSRHAHHSFSNSTSMSSMQPDSISPMIPPLTRFTISNNKS